MKTNTEYDVVLLGAGLAGLTLARQLLLHSDKRVLILDKRAEVPSSRQKVGESTVQVGAYYYGKVLDLEEYLFHEQLMKYNLRFYWKTAGRDNTRFEDYGQAYIRGFSNIPCYQLDRNTFEAELLRRNLADPELHFQAGISDLAVTLCADGPHLVTFQAAGASRSVHARWVVDTTGRGKFLARQLGLTRQNPIRHGASFLWVAGLVDIEKLTDWTPRQVRLNQMRAGTGHLPLWLATNHFCGEGFWFWVIPLRGKTSLGIVYDRAHFPRERVTSAQRMLDWVCEEFPLFARDLPRRTVLDFSALKDHSYDCAQTISASRWAFSGEAGRFTDPLYSPGSDLIALHNTLITDAIRGGDCAELTLKCRLYEQLMRSFYQATVPSYSLGYDALGDQEVFTLKYVWELSVYFPFYVFPFVNELFVDRRFIPTFLSKFARLGPLNQNIQAFLRDYYHWKKKECRPVAAPVCNDFTDLGPLRIAEQAFYHVGVSSTEAGCLLENYLDNLRELARYLVVHAGSVVLSDERILTSRAYVESIDLENLRFDPEEMRDRYLCSLDRAERYAWSFDPHVLACFRTAPVQPLRRCQEVPSA